VSPEIAARLSGVDADAIRAAARLLSQHRPVAHFSWTGLEPNVRVRPKRPIERMSDFRAPWLGSRPAENHPN
jgi:hypothetical protein